MTINTITTQETGGIHRLEFREGCYHIVTSTHVTPSCCSISTPKELDEFTTSLRLAFEQYKRVKSEVKK